jgi:hypothetical protein
MTKLSLSTTGSTSSTVISLGTKISGVSSYCRSRFHMHVLDHCNYLSPVSRANDMSMMTKIHLSGSTDRLQFDRVGLLVSPKDSVTLDLSVNIERDRL